MSKNGIRVMVIVIAMIIACILIAVFAKFSAINGSIPNVEGAEDGAVTETEDTENNVNDDESADDDLNPPVGNEDTSDDNASESPSEDSSDDSPEEHPDDDGNSDDNDDNIDDSVNDSGDNGNGDNVNDGESSDDEVIVPRYTVTFEYGILFENLITSLEVEENSEIAFPDIDIPEYYVFDGWKINGELFAENSKYTVTENVTAIATYSLKTYTITYEFNGGTCTTTGITTYNYDTYIGINLKPTKEGHIFVGWYYDAEFTQKVGSIYHMYGNLVLYAKWCKI